MAGLAAEILANPQEIVVIEFTKGWRPSSLSSVEVREASNGTWVIGPFLSHTEGKIVAESDEQLARGILLSDPTTRQRITIVLGG